MDSLTPIPRIPIKLDAIQCKLLDSQKPLNQLFALLTTPPANTGQVNPPTPHIQVTTWSPRLIAVSASISHQTSHLSSTIVEQHLASPMTITYLTPTAMNQAAIALFQHHTSNNFTSKNDTTDTLALIPRTPVLNLAAVQHKLWALNSQK